MSAPPLASTVSTSLPLFMWVMFFFVSGSWTLTRIHRGRAGLEGSCASRTVCASHLSCSALLHVVSFEDSDATVITCTGPTRVLYQGRGQGDVGGAVGGLHWSVTEAGGRQPLGGELNEQPLRSGSENRSR